MLVYVLELVSSSEGLHWPVSEILNAESFIIGGFKFRIKSSVVVVVPKKNNQLRGSVADPDPDPTALWKWL